jgi:hypothetical protein
MRSTLAGLATAAVSALPAAAADMLLLQRTVLPDETAASVVLLVDRERVALARIRQGAEPPFVVEARWPASRTSPSA